MDLEKDLKDVKQCLSEANFADTWNKVSKLKPAAIPTGKDLKECPNPKDMVNALHLRSVAAEIADYQGIFSLASEFVEKSGEYCLARLIEVIRNPKSVGENLDLLLQDVWVVLQAGLCRYRSASYDDALSMFQICQSVLSRPPLSTEKHFGAMARCLYSIGLVRRERYELKEAVKSFTESTEFAYQSLRRNAKGRTPLARLAIARVIGMGLAPLHNTLGRPDLAVPLIVSAKAMLPRGEKIISTHIDLIRATLIPWPYAAGRTDSIGEEQDRMDQLEKCYADFASLHHGPYQSRAAYYWAREHILVSQSATSAGKSKQNQDHLKKAEALTAEFESAPAGDSRFLLMAFVLKSEIARAREQWPLAESLASTGLQLATGKHPAVYLDLLMARALARISKKDPERAVEDLKSGLELAKGAGNHRVQAIFLLRLSQAYSKGNSKREATSCLNEFDKMQDFLELKAPDIAALEEEARSLVSKDLIFRYTESHSLEESEKKLRQFLARKVRDNLDSDSAAALELKISRQTYYNWMHGKTKKGKKVAMEK